MDCPVHRKKFGILYFVLNSTEDTKLITAALEQSIMGSFVKSNITFVLKN